MQVIASIAISLDGYLDDSSSERLVLSSPEDLWSIHHLRASCDAIFVGAETIRRDNPSLTARVKKPVFPAKITCTRTGKIDPSSRFFTEGDGAKIVFCQPEHSAQFNAAAEVIHFKGDIPALFKTLKERGFQRVLVENGGTIFSELMEAKLIDQLRLAIAPILIADNMASRFSSHVALDRFPLLSQERLGDTVVMIYDLSHDKK